MIVYLDDILIYMENLEEIYIKAIYLILNLLKKYDFFINLIKCIFTKIL